MTRNPINWPTAALVSVLALLIAWHSGGQASIPDSPALVGAVDLERVMMNMTGFVEANEGLDALGQQFEEEDTRLQETIQLLNEDLEQAPDGSQAQAAALRELHWTSRKRDAFLEFAQRKLAVEKARLLRGLIEDVVRVSKELAREHGLDLVVVDDSSAEIPSIADEQTLVAQIATRRTLFVSPRIDLTDEVIARLK